MAHLPSDTIFRSDKGRYRLGRREKDTHTMALGRTSRTINQLGGRNGIETFCAGALKPSDGDFSTTIFLDCIASAMDYFSTVASNDSRLGIRRLIVG